MFYLSIWKALKHGSTHKPTLQTRHHVLGFLGQTWHLLLAPFQIMLTLTFLIYCYCCTVFPRTHCVKSVQIRSFFWPLFSRIRTEYGEILSIFSSNAGKYEPEKTPYLDTFQAFGVDDVWWNLLFQFGR